MARNVGCAGAATLPVDHMPFPDAHPSLLRALAARGYAEPTAVQAAVLAGRCRRPRPAGLRPDRLGQDRGLRPRRSRPTLLGEAERFDAAGRAAGPGGGADARAGAAGRARAGLALRPDRRPRRRLRRRHGHPPRAARAGPGLPHRRRHARAGCATISSAATSTSRPCAPWCSTRPTRCSTWASARTSSSSSTPRPAERRTLLFSATIPKRDRGPRQALPARRAAHRHRRRARGARRHRVPRPAHRPERARARGRQRAALLRGARRAGVLLDPRGRAPPARQPASSAASPPWRSPAS